MYMYIINPIFDKSLQVFIYLENKATMILIVQST